MESAGTIESAGTMARVGESGPTRRGYFENVGLTVAERRVLQHMLRGESNKEISWMRNWG